MKSILTGPKVHRSNRHIFANAPNVIERQTIGPTCIAIAMRTGEIALVGEPKADRKTIGAGFFHHLGAITFRNDDTPTSGRWHWPNHVCGAVSLSPRYCPILARQQI